MPPSRAERRRVRRVSVPLASRKPPGKTSDAAFRIGLRPPLRRGGAGPTTNFRPANPAYSVRPRSGRNPRSGPPGGIPPGGPLRGESRSGPSQRFAASPGETVSAACCRLRIAASASLPRRGASGGGRRPCCRRRGAWAASRSMAVRQPQRRRLARGFLSGLVIGDPRLAACECFRKVAATRRHGTRIIAIDGATGRDGRETPFARPLPAPPPRSTPGGRVGSERGGAAVRRTLGGLVGGAARRLCGNAADRASEPDRALWRRCASTACRASRCDRPDAVRGSAARRQVRRGETAARAAAGRRVCDAARSQSSR